MDFSLFYLPTYRAGFSPSLNAFYEELTDSVKLADRLGWARVMTTEHHFHYYGGAVPNPAVILAAWARETKRIRLAAGVSLVPLRHPLQVAEDYALVDHLSHGRFDMGVSRGFVPHEFEAFGVSQADTADRVMEGLDIIKKFWKGEPFDYNGKFTSFPRVDPWPLPFQRDIPIWVAASNDLASFARAGTGGYHLMMNQYPMSFASLVEKHDTFKAAYAKAGHDPAKRKSAIAFLAHMADDEEQAIEEAKAAVQEHASAFRKVQTHNEWDRD
ncbi:MAG: LLM class flavin-dependent oxidoreductase, partial [Rhodospirillaceae bacterium]|nr:LLM class flavin-dependent oxidoreductase [Rhodospirillaceae bacterium]